MVTFLIALIVFIIIELDLKVAPAPKKTEYLSYAVPIGVHGIFSELRLGIASMGLTETSLKFIISPLSASLQKMFTKPVLEDGSDVCGMPLGPENRPTFQPAGCKRQSAMEPKNVLLIAIENW